MAIADQLLGLQWTQLKHDESYHKDIVVLPLAQRMKHMALHNAKYTAYFLDAAESTDEGKYSRTLTDAFIIVLVSANTLNQDLSQTIPPEYTTLRALGTDLAARLARDAGDPLWLVGQYVKHNGRLAKLCESWDHLESLPFRDGMKDCNAALFSVLLADASMRGVDLAESYQARLRKVEERSIFDRYLRQPPGGEF